VLAGLELPGHAGDQHAALEEQPGLEPQGTLVVEQLFPRTTNHVLGDVDDDESVWVGDTKLGNVAKDWARDIPIWGVDNGQRNRDVALCPLPFQLLNLRLPSRDRDAVSVSGRVALAYASA